MNVCVFWMCMCWRASEMKKDKDNDRVCVCARKSLKQKKMRNK